MYKTRRLFAVMYEKLLFPDGMYRKEKARKELREKGKGKNVLEGMYRRGVRKELSGE